MNAPGVHSANHLATIRGLAARAQFEQCDASKDLPFNDKTFDAVFSNDVLCHIPERLKVLREMLRVLKSGGRMLLSDALVVGGMISREELAPRSSIGYYIYSPPGENERLTEQAGFSTAAWNRHNGKCGPSGQAMAFGPGKREEPADRTGGDGQL